MDSSRHALAAFAGGVALGAGGLYLAHRISSHAILSQQQQQQAKRAARPPADAADAGSSHLPPAQQQQQQQRDAPNGTPATSSSTSSSSTPPWALDWEGDEVVGEQLTRNVQFFGAEGQRRVSAAFVVVVGLGVSGVARWGVGGLVQGRKVRAGGWLVGEAHAERRGAVAHRLPAPPPRPPARAWAATRPICCCGRGWGACGSLTLTRSRFLPSTATASPREPTWDSQRLPASPATSRVGGWVGGWACLRRASAGGAGAGAGCAPGLLVGLRVCVWGGGAWARAQGCAAARASAGGVGAPRSLLARLTRLMLHACRHHARGEGGGCGGDVHPGRRGEAAGRVPRLRDRRHRQHRHQGGWAGGRVGGHVWAGSCWSLVAASPPAALPAAGAASGLPPARSHSHPPLSPPPPPRAVLRRWRCWLPAAAAGCPCCAPRGQGQRQTPLASGWLMCQSRWRTHWREWCAPGGLCARPLSASQGRQALLTSTPTSPTSPNQPTNQHPPPTHPPLHPPPTRLKRDHGVTTGIPVLLSTERPRCGLVFGVEEGASPLDYQLCVGGWRAGGGGGGRAGWRGEDSVHVASPHPPTLSPRTP